MQKRPIGESRKTPQRKHLEFWSPIYCASERGLDLDEPAESEKVRLKLLKIRSLHGNEREERKLEITSDEDARHSVIRSDLGGFIP